MKPSFSWLSPVQDWNSEPTGLGKQGVKHRMEAHWALWCGNSGNEARVSTCRSEAESSKRHESFEVNRIKPWLVLTADAFVAPFWLSARTWSWCCGVNYPGHSSKPWSARWHSGSRAALYCPSGGGFIFSTGNVQVSARKYIWSFTRRPKSLILRQASLSKTRRLWRQVTLLGNTKIPRKPPEEM